MTTFPTPTSTPPSSPRDSAVGAEAPLLVVDQISKAYAGTVALHPTDLRIAQGEFVTLLGPSGCGKSTLLRILAGVTPASGGSIALAGRRIEALPPERRDIAMVFQSYALFPHMTVRANLSFGLRMKKVPAAEQPTRIDHAVEICKLGSLLDRLPRQLSGGQQQRVALARALVMRPALMLFDEPLSNLDAKLREGLREELVRLHQVAGTTSLYVTHDQTEAMTMSDRVVLMNGGHIVESGTPVALYRQPRHAFTANFLGQTNLIDVPLEHGTATLPWGQRGPVDRSTTGHRCLVSLRLEDIVLTRDERGPGQVTSVSFAGATVHYTLRVGEGSSTIRATRSGEGALLALGDRVTLTATALPLRALDEGWRT